MCQGISMGSRIESESTRCKPLENVLEKLRVVYVTAKLFKNRWLESFRVDDNRFGRIGVGHLLCPLTRFSTLQIQANITLKSITFEGRRTKIGRDEQITIMETLQVNPWIEEIDLARTPLQSSGKAEGIHLKLGQSAKSKPEVEVDLLKDMPMKLIHQPL
ncbi:hypothetical protein Lser_V15G44831 [Lactuca serriola]